MYYIYNTLYTYIVSYTIIHNERCGMSTENPYLSKCSSTVLIFCFFNAYLILS